MRLGVAAGGAFVFAFLMIIPALLTGDINASVGQAFGYGLLWALIGSLTGTVLAAPPTAPADQVSPRARAAGSAILAALGRSASSCSSRPRSAPRSGSSRSRPTGARAGPARCRSRSIDTTLFAVDHGVHTLELGSLAAFERRGLEPAVLNLPLPAEEPADVISNGATYRLFDYRDGVSAIVFLLMLVLLVGLPLCGALLAGFTVARERAAATPLLAAAWGALVGPVWAIALALVNALLQDTLFGHAQGESVFGIVLVFGALVGALGGYLAAGAIRSDASEAPAPTSLVRPQAPDAEPDERRRGRGRGRSPSRARRRRRRRRRSPRPAVSSSGSAVSAGSAVAVGVACRDDLARHLEVDRGVELLRLEVVARVPGVSET